MALTNSIFAQTLGDTEGGSQSVRGMVGIYVLVWVSLFNLSKWNWSLNTVAYSRITKSSSMKQAVPRPTFDFQTASLGGLK